MKVYIENKTDKPINLSTVVPFNFKSVLPNEKVIVSIVDFSKAEKTAKDLGMEITKFEENTEIVETEVVEEVTVEETTDEVVIDTDKVDTTEVVTEEGESEVVEPIIEEKTEIVEPIVEEKPEKGKKKKKSVFKK